MAARHIATLIWKMLIHRSTSGIRYPKFRALLGMLSLGCFLSLATAIHGQTTQASIRGSVRDQSGALIVGASLNLVNVDTKGAYQAWQQQNLPESIRLFREALASCDTCSISSSLHRDLGLVLCRNGQIDEGKAELQTALAMDPDDRDAAQALKILAQPATVNPSSNLSNLP